MSNPENETGEIRFSKETVQRLVDHFWPSNAYEDDNYMYVRAFKEGLHPNTRLVECYETPTGFIIVGIPPSEEEDPNFERHNCDLNGCGQSHVLYRFSKENASGRKVTKESD